MSETFKPDVDYQKLPFRHPLRQRREVLMMSQRMNEFSSALVGVRFLRVVLPYVLFFWGLIVVWNGSAEPLDLNRMLVLIGVWVFVDILVRWFDRHVKTVEEELEDLDQEIAAEIERLAAAHGGGQ